MIDKIMGGIGKLFSTAEVETHRLLNRIDRIISIKVRRFRRILLATMMQGLFIGIGIIAMVVGAILFAARFLSLDFVLIIVGLMCLYIGLILNFLVE